MFALPYIISERQCYKIKTLYRFSAMPSFKKYLYVCFSASIIFNLKTDYYYKANPYFTIITYCCFSTNIDFIIKIAPY
jgi:hypothetical protein